MILNYGYVMLSCLYVMWTVVLLFDWFAQKIWKLSSFLNNNNNINISDYFDFLPNCYVKWNSTFGLVVNGKATTFLILFFKKSSIGLNPGAVNLKDNLNIAHIPYYRSFNEYTVIKLYIIKRFPSLIYLYASPILLIANHCWCQYDFWTTSQSTCQNLQS